MKLSIILPMLITRTPLLSRLMESLQPQLNNEVEIVSEMDNGGASIGEKRNRCMGRAKGEYICSIDDDDIVSRDYVSSILAALEFKPDAVGFWVQRYGDGAPTGRAIHSMRIDSYREQHMPRTKEYIWFRSLNQLTNADAQGGWHIPASC